MKQFLNLLFRYTITLTFGGIILLIGTLIFDFSFGMALFVAVLLSLVFSMLIRPKKKKTPSLISEELPPLTQVQEDFYKEEGMSKEETKFFRETMNTAKNQILLLEKNLQQGTKLQTIEARNNTLKLAKALFKDITNEPRRLHQVDKFLYSHLPSLVDLTEKYIEISNHEVKSKTTFDMLDKSAATIDEMCQLIALDYATFKEEDLAEMDIEIALANQTIERDNEDNNEEQTEEF